jgi:hypothetical protein
MSFPTHVEKPIRQKCEVDERSVRRPIILICIHHNCPSAVALILSKTTKSAQAGFLASPNSVFSRSHNFPNGAPIDVLFDSGCSLDPVEEICELTCLSSRAGRSFGQLLLHTFVLAIYYLPVRSFHQSTRLNKWLSGRVVRNPTI